MTCRDCLHYERCKKLGIFNVETLSVCEDFTAHSEWVHLPCKVGDKLYKVVPNFEKPRGNLKIQEYTVTGFIANALITRPYNVFGVHRIGADVFLTRKEAEKALEGMK